MAATKYEESVPASWWLSWAIYPVVMGLVVVGGVILFDDGISGASRVLSVIILIGVIVLMVVISLIFTRLHIKVAADSIRFNFGPFGRTVKRGKIAGVDVDPTGGLPTVVGGFGLRPGHAGHSLYRAVAKG